MQSILIGAFIVCVVGAFFSQAVLLWALLRGEKATIQTGQAGKWIMLFFAGAVVLYMVLAATAPKQQTEPLSGPPEETVSDVSSISSEAESTP